ncbi:hypothetical protein AB3N04_04630 [Alkalihalophilus sp. As8PL]|uniref:TMhelix containing protein n=1 Tax=Alkalihalophilus sp. As8PL TaxID=3237103 RepID=A0AB39BUU9_9BACI
MMMWLITIGVAAYTAYYARIYFLEGNKVGGVAVGGLALFVLCSPFADLFL